MARPDRPHLMARKERNRKPHTGNAASPSSSFRSKQSWFTAEPEGANVSNQRYRELFNKELNRRRFLVHGAAAGAAVALGPSALTLAQDTIDTTE
jgi:hypothetical protein